MFRPNEVTKEKEKEILVKFKEHEAGIHMGTYTQNEGDGATYKQLMDTSLHSTSSIVNKMRNISSQLNSRPEDSVIESVLGENLNVAFVKHTERDEKILFTYEDMYIFLRAILRERSATAEYIKAKARKTELQSYIEKTKTPAQKRKDAKKELKELEAITG